MSNPNTCPRCGATLPPGTPAESCPRCLLGVGLESSEATRAGAATATSHAAMAGSPPTPDELAVHFPQLEILEILGQGGMGVVYRARQKSLDRDVALKILAVGSSVGSDFSERFAREARTLASLSHPAIVTVYDFGRVDRHFFLTMEYVDGANLRQIMEAGDLTPKESLNIVSQICEALQFAHDAGVVHRDIKPENILVDTGGRVKIADFGLAKILGRDAGEARLTRDHQAMGTAHYMAPEQIEHPLDVDHRADIYSLGVVFYELLTHELPLGRFAPPSRKIEVDVRVDEVVLRTLEKEPRRRYQMAGDVKTEVDHISAASASPGPSAAAGAVPPPRKAPARRWHPVAVVLAVLSVPALALLAAVVLFGRGADSAAPTDGRAGRSSSRGNEASGASAPRSRSKGPVDREAQALVDAAGEGHMDGVLALLDAGVAVNAEGIGGNRAIVAASGQGHVEVVRLLLDRGADPNAPGVGNNRALIAAADGGHFDIAAMLLDQGADPNLAGIGGGTALIVAADRGQPDLVTRLLEAGADPSQKGVGEGTALIAAVDSRLAGAVDRLLAAGADVNATGIGGQRALIVAAGRGHAEVVARLIEAGADPNLVGVGNQTALIEAVDSGKIEIVESLLDAGADVNAPGIGGSRPLVVASARGRADLAGLLLAAGADPDLRGVGGQTALIEAVSSGRVDLVEMLLAAGADLDAEGIAGTTALAIAASRNHAEILAVLAEARRR